jgi:flagellar export protein FliJ
MAPFRFRGAAALGLRQRQEDEAAHALARFEANLLTARKARTAAEADLARAQHRATAGGIHMSDFTWHVNWIVRQHSVVRERIDEERERHAEADTARRAWQEARRRRLVIERWRDRALERHKADADRHERVELDELARLRFAYARMREGESPDGRERSNQFDAE